MIHDVMNSNMGCFHFPPFYSEIIRVVSVTKICLMVSSILDFEMRAIGSMCSLVCETSPQWLYWTKINRKSEK